MGLHPDIDMVSLQGQPKQGGVFLRYAAIQPESHVGMRRRKPRYYLG